MDAIKLERILELIEEEMQHPLHLFYLSYADDKGFRGVVYVEAHGPASAAMRANAYNLSPGGEVFIVEVPDDKLPDYKYWNRLLTKAEVQAANPDDECKTIREWEEQDNNG
jgi:hypothetical protein